MKFAFLILPSIIFSSAPLLNAQILGNGNQNSGPGTFPGATTSNIPSQSSQNFPGASSASPSYSGKVAMADGSPLPGNLSIIRKCMGDQRTVAYTDSKGHFTFSVGGPGSLIEFGDASDSSGPTSVGTTRQNVDSSRVHGASPLGSFNGCELTVELPGYRADVISLDRFNGIVVDVGTIVVHRLENVEGTSVSATLFKAPPDAKKAYEKGMQSLQKNKPADAIKDLTKAVTVYPQFANAWLELGHANARLSQPEAAHDAFLKALEADPKLVQAQVELGVSAAQNRKWREASQYLDEALKLDPVDFPQIWFTAAVADFNSGNYDGAEKNAREALKIDTAHKNPMVDQLLGMALAQKHDFAGAAEELRIYLKLAPTANDFNTVKAQLAQIEKLQAEGSH